MTDTAPPTCTVEVGPLRARVVLFGEGENKGEARFECGEPLVRASDGPCEHVYPNTGMGRGGFSGQQMTACGMSFGEHSTAPTVRHTYEPPLVCPLHPLPAPASTREEGQ